VSALYLIRHGQAGPRHRYDALSELGQRQAAALGEHLAGHKTHFQTVITGGLERQRRTAERVLEAYAQSGEPAPELVIDRRWDEFDLGRVFEELGPKLARDDAAFARSYEQMLAEMQDEHAAVHRVHNPCDIAIVTAWVEGRYQYGGESWPEFRARILEAVASLEGQEPGRKTAVFTSATPVGIAVAHALGLDEQQLWRLAGVAYNTSITTLRHSRDELRLFSFNGLPHLTDAAMWSFR
jgi:broad specificity phosphatase PhoE